MNPISTVSTLTTVRAADGPMSGDDARRAAQRELSRVRYHRDDPSLINRFFTWFFGRLDHLGGASLGTSAFAVLVVVLLAAVIFMIVRAGRPTRTARSSVGRPDLLSPVGARDHVRVAEELTRAGSYADALREWLRATVRTLEVRGVLDPRPGRTADEVARAASAQLPDAAEALLAATRAFDEIWFGARAAEERDAEYGRAAYSAVRAARTRPSAVDPTSYALPG